MTMVTASEDLARSSSSPPESEAINEVVKWTEIIFENCC